MASIEKRRLKRAETTRTCNAVLQSINDLSVEQCSKYIVKLESLKHDLHILDNKIFDATFATLSSEECEAAYQRCSEYEDEILTVLVALKTNVDKIKSEDTQQNVSNNVNSTLNNNLVTPSVSSKVKIPQIPLPNYSHKPGEDLYKFFSNFENIMSKYNLTDFEQFIYLKNQVSNEPLIILESLEASSQTYAAARKLLEEAFASPMTLINNTIERITKLKLAHYDSPYTFIAQIRQLDDNINNLKIDGNNFFRYFVWHGLNQEMKEQLISITNTNTPSLDQIKDNMFKAAERYIIKFPKKNVKVKSYTENYVSENETVSALSVKNKEKQGFCSLCSFQSSKCTSHCTYNCSVYKTADEKVQKLLSINGCIKCGNNNHTTKKCHYRFKNKCSNCNQYHFTYLCKAVNRKDSASEVNASSIYVGRTSACSYGSDSIIPSFSLNVKGKSLRVMRDSGCQPNIITCKAANELNLEVINPNFNITIRGVNADEKCNTKLVKLPVGEDQLPLVAICLPEIKVNLKLPKLGSLVKAFEGKGYCLADKELNSNSDSLNKFDMILGNIDAQLLPQREIVFGCKPYSVYAETKYGVIIQGSIDRMITNIQFLPDLNRKNTGNTGKGIKQAKKIKKKNSGRSSSKSVSEGNIKLHSFEVSIDTSDIDTDKLNKASELIENHIPNMIYDQEHYTDDIKLEDERLNSFVLESMRRDDDGRLVVPLLWNESVSDRLGANYNLSRAILKSNVKRLSGNIHKLKLYDSAIRDHINAGVLEPISDITAYINEHPNTSFISHMPVFRMNHESTKCRVVLLSNLVEENNINAISHNQAMVSGGNLNSKLSTALSKLRFDSYLLIFDIKKAFLNVGLNEIDKDRLLIFWIENLQNLEKIVAYKYNRLPFGLRCSPTLLMLCLYKILVLDNIDCDSDTVKLKKLIYDLTYMDNCAVTSNDPMYLKHSYDKLNGIFNPYCFSLQQFATNESSLQNSLSGVMEDHVKLFGHVYNIKNDTLSTNPIKLDKCANTKRKILSSIASNFDILQINGPLINRARLFAHRLICNKSLNWDEVIPSRDQKEWKNIAVQANSGKSLVIPRFVGARDSKFELIACTDASKTFLGSVLYIKDLNNNTLTFLSAKNRIVSNKLEGKTIPTLEAHAISLGCEHISDTWIELTEKALVPINVVKASIYSDSIVALSWISRYEVKLEKMPKLSSFVANRIMAIRRICEKTPISFCHISGELNPADFITRQISYKTLVKSCYLTAPSFLTDDNYDQSENCYTFKLPVQLNSSDNYSSEIYVDSINMTRYEPIISSGKYSCLFKLIRVYRNVYKFVNKLKSRITSKKGMQNSMKSINCDFAYHEIIKSEQKTFYSDILQYFASKNVPISSTPKLIFKLNLFLDTDGIIRVRSKFKEWKANISQQFPILLPRESPLTKLIITNYHETTNHSGVYYVINQLRKEYYIQKIFSTVKAVLKECLVCRRVNARAIKTNQSFYRDFRENPPNIPFRYIFIDHFGPYKVKDENETKKVWVLCITCLWSRAVNLKICHNMSVNEFLRTLQLHIYDYGIPEKVFSDLGSQIVAGGNVISDMLKKPSCKEFFDINSMKSTEFIQYFKGNHELGSLVESCVKLSKRLINGSIRNSVLKIPEFELIIAQSVHLANKRPICFKDGLRSTDVMEEIPAPITPELLIKGYDTPSINILPEGRSGEEFHIWSNRNENLRSLSLSSDKLKTARENLKKIYHEEFLQNLVAQAVAKNNQFMPVRHEQLKVGDIVLLKEDLTKSTNYPMARVKRIFRNDLEEVTSVEAVKSNKETVKRHVASVIPYMSLGDNDEPVQLNQRESKNLQDIPNRPNREAAKMCRKRISELYDSDKA